MTPSGTARFSAPAIGLTGVVVAVAILTAAVVATTIGMKRIASAG